MTQKGNALFFILIAIGLLGLLTVMMSRSSNTSNETGDYEQNVIQANQILSYAKNMENAVQGLLARGCSENELSFWHDSDGNGTEDTSDDYYNDGSPPDKSCHIFDVAGAGLSWEEPKENITGEDWFIGPNIIRDFDSTVYLVSDKQDLTIILSDISDSLCKSINNISNDYTIWESGGAHNGPHDTPEEKFSGNYSATIRSINLATIDATALPPNSGCFCDGSDNTCPNNQKRYFYHVLHAR